LVFKRTFENIFTLKQIMFRLALLMKYLPNAKHIQIISSDLMDILCYLLVLPQTDEKYGKLQILFAPILSILRFLIWSNYSDI
jgi:hypothetical protein